HPAVRSRPGTDRSAADRRTQGRTGAAAPPDRRRGSRVRGCGVVRRGRGMKRVLLVGLGPTSLTAAQSLVGRFDVVGIVRAVDPNDALIRLAQSAGIRIYGDKSPRAIDQVVADLEPDCVVVSSYDR